MRAQTILFLSVDGVKEKLDCRPYRGRGEGNPKKLVEAASRAFPTLSIILTIRGRRPGYAKAASASKESASRVENWATFSFDEPQGCAREFLRGNLTGLEP
jgi:hypothetical protein